MNGVLYVRDQLLSIVDNLVELNNNDNLRYIDKHTIEDFIYYTNNIDIELDNIWRYISTIFEEIKVMVYKEWDRNKIFELKNILNELSKVEDNIDYYKDQPIYNIVEEIEFSESSW